MGAKKVNVLRSQRCFIAHGMQPEGPDAPIVIVQGGEHERNECGKRECAAHNMQQWFSLFEQAAESETGGQRQRDIGVEHRVHIDASATCHKGPGHEREIGIDGDEPYRSVSGVPQYKSRDADQRDHEIRQPGREAALKLRERPQSRRSEMVKKIESEIEAKQAEAEKR